MQKYIFSLINKQKTMAKVYVFLADGFEDIEALAPVDILRRGGLDVTTVSVMETEEVVSAHGVTVLADSIFYDVAVDGGFESPDLLILPGGMPGASNLRASAVLCDLLIGQAESGRRIAAICAAPYILGELGLLKGLNATCYPGFERHLKGANYTADLVTTDGNITTGRGPAAALPFAYELLSFFVDDETVEQIKQGMIYSQLMGQ